MKCPYNDIGCWWIDDVSHDCEAAMRSDCPHERQGEPERSPRKEGEEE